MVTDDCTSLGMVGGWIGRFFFIDAAVGLNRVAVAECFLGSRAYYLPTYLVNVFSMRSTTNGGSESSRNARRTC